MNFLGKFCKNCKIFLFTILLTVSVCLPSCAKKTDTEPVSRSGIFFDTVITITLYDSAYSGSNGQELLDSCFLLCEQYEELFSTTIPTSDISQINQQAPSPVSVDDATMELLDIGLRYCALSQGHFDITIGALSSLWDFSSGKHSVPEASQIAAALQTVDYRQVQMKNGQVSISDPNAVLDLGGIAKGYIADALKSYLTENGVTSGIIDLGGNILLIGAKPDGSNYNIGIRTPFAEAASSIAILRISDCSIVSSGNYERYFYDDNGTLYHHILDTATGYPISNGLNAVTIISPASVDGDALSTTCFSLGLQEGMELIESLENVEAVFIDCENHLTLSSGLKQSGDIITISSK